MRTISHSQFSIVNSQFLTDPSGLKSEKERGDKMLGMETIILEIAMKCSEFVRITSGLFKKKKKLDTPLIPQPIDDNDEN